MFEGRTDTIGLSIDNAISLSSTVSLRILSPLDLMASLTDSFFAKILSCTFSPVLDTNNASAQVRVLLSFFASVFLLVVESLFLCNFSHLRSLGLWMVV